MKKILALTMGLMVLGSGALAQEKGVKETTIAAGITATDGNSEITQGNATLLSTYKTSQSECRGGVEFNYGTISGDTTNENGKVFAGYRRTVSDRVYGLTDITLAYDAIADIDYRLTLAPGLGYYVAKNDKTTFGVEFGPAYVWEEVSGVSDDYFALRFADRIEHKLSDTAKIWQAAEYLPRADDFDDYLLNAEIGAEAAMNASFSLRLVASDKYDSTPAEGKQRNDLTITGAVVYKL